VSVLATLSAGVSDVATVHRADDAFIGQGSSARPAFVATLALDEDQASGGGGDLRSFLQQCGHLYGPRGLDQLANVG
jgi:hypothetical protein